MKVCDLKGTYFQKKNVRWSVVKIRMLIYVTILLIMAVINIVM